MPLAVAAWVVRLGLPPRPSVTLTALLIIGFPAVAIADSTRSGHGDPRRCKWRLRGVHGGHQLVAVVRRPRCAGLHLAGVAVSPAGLPEAAHQRYLTQKPIDWVQAGTLFSLKRRLARAVGRVRAGLRALSPSSISYRRAKRISSSRYWQKNWDSGVFWFLLLLYGLVVIRGLWISFMAQTSYGRLLASAITLTFCVYVIVNMGMVAGILPVVGVPLPFVSFGGTSIVTLLLGFGILSAISTEKRIISQ